MLSLFLAGERRSYGRRRRGANGLDGRFGAEHREMMLVCMDAWQQCLCVGRACVLLPSLCS